MYYNNKVLLLILDGWGHGKTRRADAIANANTPFVSSLYNSYSNAELTTHGEAVGLPFGQMGNSEVGHLNIGAGRAVLQDLLKLNRAVEDGSLFEEEALLNLVQYAKSHQKPVHLLGLVSEGGVHSHSSHLKALCDFFVRHEVENIFIHAFTDGRDTDPHSGAEYLQDIQNHIQFHSNIKIASVIGRYYAMDRDKRWERVKKAYDLLAHGIGTPTERAVRAVQESYRAGVTDEFVLPVVCVDKETRRPLTTIQQGDAVLCFNFRTDRCREITQCLTQMPLEEYGMQPLDLYYVTMTEYDKTFKNVKVVLEEKNLTNTLGEVLEQHQKTQLRVAETEKYPHVTFFFSGGREMPFKGEDRILVASPKVATYDLQPEMSVYEVTEQVCNYLDHNKPNFVCINFANADMVGHTGVWSAVVKAVESVDACTRQVVEKALSLQYSIFIIADHGNADLMKNEDDTPNTAHTKNPVPVFFVDNKFHPRLKNGVLADIAPSILQLMQIPIPAEMSGASLFDL